MGFIKDLPKSQGYEVILVVVDLISKYNHFLSLTHLYTAPSVARLFADNVFKLHGMLLSNVSDRGPVFTSTFWHELFKLQGTQLKHNWCLKGLGQMVSISRMVYNTSRTQLLASRHMKQHMGNPPPPTGPRKLQ